MIAPIALGYTDAARVAEARAGLVRRRRIF